MTPARKLHTPEENGEPDTLERTRLLTRERRAQVRGLLLLALVLLALLLWRGAGPLHLFAAGWWRL